jgi:ABC-type phosphate/phosphonate transport system permease subunit
MDQLIWALAFVREVGPGPLAGVMATRELRQTQFVDFVSRLVDGVVFYHGSDYPA